MSFICLRHFRGLPVFAVQSLKSLNLLAYWLLNDLALSFPLWFHLMPDSAFFFLAQATIWVCLWFLDFTLLSLALCLPKCNTRRE